MPFSRPSLQQIIDRIEADFTTRVENAASFLRRSVYKIFARAYGGAVYTLYGYLNFIKDQLFITSADAEYLEQHGLEYGIIRKSAVKATGGARVTGTNGYIVPEGTELQFIDDQVYLLDEAVVIAGGYADIVVTAKVAGTAGNQNPAATLTFVSPLVGINTSVTVDSLGILGGLDQETDDELRERILTRKRQPPHGGADFDYSSWALEVSGVTRVWTFPLYQGVGTIGVAFVRDNDLSTILPNSTQRQEVYDYIVEHTDTLTGLTVGCPVTAQPGLFIIDLSLESIDFSLAISPNDVNAQTNARAALTNLLIDKGGPGETLYLSDIIRYVSAASGIIAVRLVSPLVDKAVATNRVPVLGTVSFGAY